MKPSVPQCYRHKNPSHSFFNLVRMFICLLIVSMATTACGRLNTSAGEYQAQGEKFAADGDMKSAIISFKNAANKAPDNPKIRYQLGHAYLETGRFIEAEKELGQAVDLDPTNPRYNLDAAKTLVRLGRWTEVETLLAGSEDWERDLQASALSLRAQLQLSANKVAAAQLVVDEAVLTAPENSDVLYARALVELAKKDTGAAEITLKKVIHANPDHAQSLNMLGTLAYQAADYDTARDMFAQSRRIEFSNLESTLGLARVYLAMEDYDEASAELAKLQAAVPDAWYPNYLKSVLELRKQNYSAALEDSDKAINVNQDYLPAYFVAASAAAALEEYETARARVNKLLFVAPNHVPSQRLLAFINMKTGQVQESISELSKIDPNNFKPSDTQLLLAAGQVALAGGDEALAQSFFDSASNLGDVESEIYRIQIESAFARGDTVTGLTNASALAEKHSNPLIALYATGARLLAQRDLKRAMEIAAELQKDFPDQPQGAILQGMAYALQDDYEKADKAFNVALDLDPENVDALSNLAVMAAEQGNLGQAKSYWTKVLSVEADKLKALLQLYKIELALGDEKQALSWLEKAVESHPNNTYAIRMLAQYRVAHGKSEQALAMFESALTADPNNYEITMLYGEMLQVLGQTAMASKQFIRAAGLQPANTLPLYRLAVLNEESGQIDESEHYAARVLATDSTHSGALLIAARNALRENDTELAGTYLVKLQNAEPNQFYTRELNAQITLASGHPEEAAELFAELYQEQQSSILINQYAVSLWNSAQRDKAVEILTTSLDKNPEDIVSRKRLASYLVAEEQYEEAQHHFALLVAQSPTASNHNDLAWIMQHQGDTGAALKHAAKAYELDPKNPAVMDTLGMIYYELGELKEAADLLEAAVSAAPGNLGFKNHLAQIKVAFDEKGER